MEKRDVQAATLPEATWSEYFNYVDGGFANMQFFVDVPSGVYNMGVQDLGDAGHPDEPFVAYYDQVPVTEATFLELTPCEDAIHVVTVSVDCAFQINGADVYLNIAEGKGFLTDDLTPGRLQPSGGIDGVLSFSVTPWMYWDLAVVEKRDPMNYFLIAQSFNATDKAITFDLCKDGVDWIQPNMDKDWDSAKLLLTPPGNLNSQWFDIHTTNLGLEGPGYVRVRTWS
jgi:hypothetical protein